MLGSVLRGERSLAATATQNHPKRKTQNAKLKTQTPPASTSGEVPGSESKIDCRSPWLRITSWPTGSLTDTKKLKLYEQNF